MLGSHRAKRVRDAVTVGVALTALATLVAMAARDPLSGATRIGAQSASLPVSASFLLLAGTAAAGLAALLAAMWSAPRRRQPDDPQLIPRTVRLHWAWKLAAVIVPLLLGAALLIATIIALGRSPRPLLGPGPAISRREAVPAPVAPAARPGFELPAWLPWTVVGLLLAATLLVGAWLMARRSSLAAGPPVGETHGMALGGAIGALDSITDPRRAVIAAYVAMEQALSRHGLIRSPVEAPREYLRRVLLANYATEREARALTELFEEARFSHHPVGEEARRRARATLTSLRTRLGGEYR